MAIENLIVLLVGLALALFRLADAQQAKKVPRIGIFRRFRRSPFRI